MNKRKILVVALGCLALALFVAPAALPVVFAEDTTATDTNSAIMMWIPTIVTFAMIGMIMGLLKKLGKW